MTEHRHVLNDCALHVFPLLECPYCDVCPACREQGHTGLTPIELTSERRKALGLREEPDNV